MSLSKGHGAHLEHAFHDIYNYGIDRAYATLSERFRALAISGGMPGKFNVTLTACWVAIMAHAISEHPTAETLAELLVFVPELADSKLPYRYYSPDRIGSNTAKDVLIAPDLLDLPELSLLGKMNASLASRTTSAFVACERLTNATSLTCSSVRAVKKFF